MSCNNGMITKFKYEPFFNLKNLQDVNDDGVWFESHFTPSKPLMIITLFPILGSFALFIVNLNLNSSIQIKTFNY